MTATEQSSRADVEPGLRFEDIRLIDTDSHVSEPVDLWTSRMHGRWAEYAPHVEMDDDWGEARWVVGDQWLSPVGFFSMAGWKEFKPSHPLTLEEGDKGAWDPVARLEKMDEYGVYAQVLYPNVIAFNSVAFRDLGPEPAEVCTSVYNDFVAEFASRDAQRLIPLMVLPFWDVQACVREMHRAAALGHRGIVWYGKFEQASLPHFTARHWDPVYAAAQELGLSVNFHAGFRTDEHFDRHPAALSAKKAGQVVAARERARATSASMLSLAETLSHVLTSDLCARFPELRFISVESGFGYMPYFLESLDWHWMNDGCNVYHPEALLPSEYFRRQVYGTFWFERSTLRLLDLYPDNFMFETDYPHPTSLSPGPASTADVPSVHVRKAMADLTPEVARKVFQDNAAKVYGVTL